MINQENTFSGLHVVDRRVEVPLDWGHPDDGRTLQVFVREVCSAGKRDDNLPLLVFLQGGPGGKCPRPTAHGPTWLHEATRHFRVLLPDQRGTGRSSRITDTIMDGFDTPEAAADYLSHFDAHAIVADLEHIRKTVYGDVRWHTLGQSYGGFITLTYLSWAPKGLEKCMITGGIPDIHPDADTIYPRTYAIVARKVTAHCRRFPGDRQKLDDIADFITANQPMLPNGDPLTVRRFQTLGLMLGMGDGSERLHWLLEEAFTDDRKQELNRHFLTSLMTLTGLDDNPLFAAIHENLYANPHRACNWAAKRHKSALFAESHRPLYLTGEMMFPWMFDEISALRSFKRGVHTLANRCLEKPFYNPDQLARNTVPVAAVIYYEDMYVDRELSVETAEAVGNLTYWVTSEYEHDGLRQDPRVFTRLLDMLGL